MRAEYLNHWIIPMFFNFQLVLVKNALFFSSLFIAENKKFTTVSAQEKIHHFLNSQVLLVYWVF